MNKRLFLRVLCCVLLISSFVFLTVRYGRAEDALVSIENEIFRLVNVERQKNGLSLLSYDSRVVNAARQHSKAMVEWDFFDHTSPVAGYKTLDARYEKAGITGWSSIAENIFSCSEYSGAQKIAQFMVNGWMNSKGHRENILKQTFTYTGVGVAKSSGGTYYATQDFAAYFKGSEPTQPLVSVNIADEVFNWFETNFSQYFFPGGTKSQQGSGNGYSYYYRLYSGSTWSGLAEYSNGSYKNQLIVKYNNKWLLFPVSVVFPSAPQSSSIEEWYKWIK